MREGHRATFSFIDLLIIQLAPSQSRPVPSIAHPGVVRFDGTFVFHPLRPLRNFAGAHDDPAKEADGEEEDLKNDLQQNHALEAASEMLPPEEPALSFVVDARQHD